MVLVSKESCDFAHREAQLEEILDALQIGVKLTFLNGALWFSQHKPRHGWLTHPGSEDDRCPMHHDGGKIFLFCEQIIVVIGLFQ